MYFLSTSSFKLDHIPQKAPHDEYINYGVGKDFS